MIFLWYYHTKTSTNFSKKKHNMYPKNTISRINKTNPANNCCIRSFCWKNVFFFNTKKQEIRFFFGEQTHPIIHQRSMAWCPPRSSDTGLASCLNGEWFFRVFFYRFFSPKKGTYFNRTYIFQASFFRGYVSFQGGIDLFHQPELFLTPCLGKSLVRASLQDPDRVHLGSLQFTWRNKKVSQLLV